MIEFRLFLQMFAGLFLTLFPAGESTGGGGGEAPWSALVWLRLCGMFSPELQPVPTSSVVFTQRFYITMGTDWEPSQPVIHGQNFFIILEVEISDRFELRSSDYCELPLADISPNGL